MENDTQYRDKGYEAMLNYYSDFIQYYGWRLDSNWGSPELASDRKIFLESRGLEVFIGPVNFFFNGKKDPNGKVVLKRANKN